MKIIIINLVEGPRMIGNNEAEIFEEYVKE